MKVQSFSIYLSSHLSSLFPICFVFNFVFYFYLCVCVSVYMQVSVGDVRDQKKTLDPLELVLHAVVSCLMWVQGTMLESYGRIASSLN